MGESARWPATASTAAQRTRRDPCLVMWPRRTFSSDSRWVGVRPAQLHRCLAEENREMSPISATKIEARIGEQCGHGRRSMLRAFPGHDSQHLQVGVVAHHLMIGAWSRNLLRQWQALDPRLKFPRFISTVLTKLIGRHYDNPDRYGGRERRRGKAGKPKGEQN